MYLTMIDAYFMISLQSLMEVHSNEDTYSWEPLAG